MQDPPENARIARAALLHELSDLASVQSPAFAMRACFGVVQYFSPFAYFAPAFYKADIGAYHADQHEKLQSDHTKLKSTVRYLGIEVNDALEMAEQTEV